MSVKIWGVRYPKLAFDIVGHALASGWVDLGTIQSMLIPWRNKSKSEGYLNLCLQTGLLYPRGDKPTGWYDAYGATPRGRSFYLAAQKEQGNALGQLFASMPLYRFHAELLLSEVLLVNSLRRPALLADLRELIVSAAPWFFDERLLWIQEMLGWIDSTSYTAGDVAKLHQRLHGLNALYTWVDGDSCSYWDEILGFANGPDLGRAERLSKFLQNARQQPLWLQTESLSSAALRVLILLMVAREQGYAVASQWCGTAIDELRRMGIPLQSDDDAVYLSCPLELAIGEPTSLSRVYEGTFACDVQ